MTDVVWVSRSFGNAVNNPGFVTDILERNSDLAVTLDRSNRQGAPLGPEELPRWGKLVPTDAKRKKLRDFATAGTFSYMSAKCAAIFVSFDLGRGRLQPITLFEADGATPLKGDWFAINYGNIKPCLVPAASKELLPAPRGTFMACPAFEDGDLAFERSALDGPDVWIDPMLQQCFCLSDRLATALEAAGILPAFDRVRRAAIAN